MIAATLKTLFVLSFLLSLPKLLDAGVGGVLGYGICQSACNAGYVTCLAPTGFVAGTFTLGAGIPAAVFGCCAAQGLCMAACAAFALNPAT